MNMSKDKMMRKVQQLAFSVHETVLFLDCHPNCKAALAYYAKQNEELKKAVAVYEMHYGPLTQNGNGGDTWEWTKGPWPWKYEANVRINGEDAKNVALR